MALEQWQGFPLLFHKKTRRLVSCRRATQPVYNVYSSSCAALRRLAAHKVRRELSVFIQFCGGFGAFGAFWCFLVFFVFFASSFFEYLFLKFCLPQRPFFPYKRTS